MYSTWEPKAFDASALEGEDGKEQIAATAGQQQQQGAAQGKAGEAAEAGGGGSASTPSGFVYDPSSGYW